MKIKVGALAAILGGVLFVLQTVAWSLTHGIQPDNSYARFLGLSARQVAQTVDTPMWICLLLALIGLNALRIEQDNRWQQLGFLTAAAGYALAIIGTILYVWIFDPDFYIYSPVVHIGRFLLQLAPVVQSVGMVLFGVMWLRQPRFRRWNQLPLLIGLLLLPTLFLRDYLAGQSPSLLQYNLLSLPYALCWILIGYRTIAWRDYYERLFRQTHSICCRWHRSLR